MARSTVAQRVQVGVEDTPGTTVAANKSLGSLSFAMNPSVETSTFRPKGNKYPTVVAPNKEFAEGDLTGTPTYDEIVYALSSVFGKATVTTVGAATTWVFSPVSEGADDPQTYTVEEGDAAQAERTSHVLVTDFSMDIARDEVSLDGSAIGQRVETGVALTPAAAPVVPDLVPILPGQVCVYVSDDPATLGDPANRQGTVLHANPSIGGRFNPVWYLNCVLDSFGAFVEAPEPDFAIDYMVEANAAGMAWLDHYRDASTWYVRIEATGPEIEAGVNYKFTWDFAVKVDEPGEKSDEDGIYAISPALTVVHSPSWGKATQITVVNTVAAL